MIQVRRSSERGHFDHGWLDTFHTFSFAGYFDPAFLGFRNLRVINEDRVAAGEGFGTHSHRDMEIITYVLQGELAHQDSMGNGSTILPGDVQYMSAGTGVLHSEFNHSKTGTTHLMQIWILPDREGGSPRYDQKTFTEEQKRGKLCLVASGDAQAARLEGAILIRQDVRLYVSVLDGSPRNGDPRAAGQALRHELAPGRHGWVQVLRGRLLLNGIPLQAGDGAVLSEERALELSGTAKGTEFLLFDLN